MDGLSIVIREEKAAWVKREAGCRRRLYGCQYPKRLSDRGAAHAE